MAGRDPLGKLALLVILLVMVYDTIFSLVKVATETMVSIFESATGFIDNLIVLWGGGEPVFPHTEQLLENVFSWEVFVFTNAMALAVILFIDVVKLGFRG